MSLSPSHAQYSDHATELGLIYEIALKLSKNLPDDYIFVETGTRAGGSALAILNAIKDSGSHRWLFTIDPYGEKPYRIGDEFATNLEYDENKYRTAMKVLANYAYTHKLNHHHFRMTSTDWMDFMEEGQFWDNGDTIRKQFGFAYLDGDHDSVTVDAECSWLLSYTNDITILIDDADYLDAQTTALGHRLGDKLLIEQL